MSEPTLLWPYHKAPKWAQDIHGPDDCDWIVVTPPGEELPCCIDEDILGCCSIEEKQLETGHTVYTGRHS